MEILPRTEPDVPPRVRRFIVAAVAILTGTALIGTALSPYLLVEHPLLLIGLNPDSRHLVLVANRVELWQAVVVGTLRRSLNFVATFGLGGVYGYMLITWLEKKRPWVKKVIGGIERIYAHLGIWLIVFEPLYWVAALAGIARVPPVRYCVAIIPGQIAFVFGVLRFGEAIEAWTTPIIDFVARHPLETTLAAIALVTVQQLYSRWRKRNKPQGEPDIPL